MTLNLDFILLGFLVTSYHIQPKFLSQWCRSGLFKPRGRFRREAAQSALLFSSALLIAPVNDISPVAFHPELRVKCTCDTLLLSSQVQAWDTSVLQAERAAPPARPSDADRLTEHPLRAGSCSRFEPRPPWPQAALTWGHLEGVSHGR